ncbi:MAG: hypothetical protein ACR2HV_05245, partial [Acidimicrobiales bacterium]
ELVAQALAAGRPAVLDPRSEGGGPERPSQRGAGPERPSERAAEPRTTAYPVAPTRMPGVHVLRIAAVSDLAPAWNHVFGTGFGRATVGL